jgi:hypothetical protein
MTKNRMRDNAIYDVKTSVSGVRDRVVRDSGKLGKQYINSKYTTGVRENSICTRDIRQVCVKIVYELEIYDRFAWPYRAGFWQSATPPCPPWGPPSINRLRVIQMNIYQEVIVDFGFARIFSGSGRGI